MPTPDLPIHQAFALLSGSMNPAHQPADNVPLPQQDTLGWTIGELPRKELARSMLIRSRDEVPQIAEPGMEEACTSLYDKNIQTTFTSVTSPLSSRGVMFPVLLIINFDALSEPNKEIAKREADGIDQAGLYRGASFCMHSATPSTTTAEISRWAIERTERFEPQAPDWIPRWSWEDALDEVSVLTAIGVIEPFKEWSVDHIVHNPWITRLNSWSPEQSCFFSSAEHHQKVDDFERSRAPEHQRVENANEVRRAIQREFRATLGQEW